MPTPRDTAIETVHVITSLEVGGAQRMLLKLLKHSDRERFPARVVSLIDGGALKAPIEALGVQVRGLGMRPGRIRLGAARELAGDLRRQRPGLVQTWLYHADLLGTLAARFAGRIPLIWNVRCTFAAGAGGWAARLAPRLCARLSRAPQVIVTNSRAGQRSHEAIGYRSRDWELIPNGFDLEEFRPDPARRAELRARWGLPAEAFVLGHVARWHPMKNHRTLFALADRMRASHPELHHVYVGSGVDASEPAVAEALAQNGATDRMQLLGESSDVASVLPAFDALISPSTYYEGFPNVLGEAMACGLPCVTTNVGDSAEVVGDTGRVVASAGLDDLQGALEQLLALEPVDREELGARARARVAERYGIERVVRRYEELYARVGERSVPR